MPSETREITLADYAHNALTGDSYEAINILERNRTKGTYPTRDKLEHLHLTEYQALLLMGEVAQTAGGGASPLAIDAAKAQLRSSLDRGDANKKIILLWGIHGSKVPIDRNLGDKAASDLMMRLEDERTKLPDWHETILVSGGLPGHFRKLHSETSCGASGGDTINVLRGAEKTLNERTDDDLEKLIQEHKVRGNEVYVLPIAALSGRRNPRAILPEGPEGFDIHDFSGIDLHIGKLTPIDQKVEFSTNDTDIKNLDQVQDMLRGFMDEDARIAGTVCLDSRQGLLKNKIIPEIDLDYVTSVLPKGWVDILRPNVRGFALIEHTEPFFAVLGGRKTARILYEAMRTPWAIARRDVVGVGRYLSPAYPSALSLPDSVYTNNESRRFLQKQLPQLFTNVSYGSGYRTFLGEQAEIFMLNRGAMDRITTQPGIQAIVEKGSQAAEHLGHLRQSIPVLTDEDPSRPTPNPRTLLRRGDQPLGILV